MSTGIQSKIPGAALLLMTTALAACGGDGGSTGGGVVSTPPPSYTRIVDMTGNRTFQTAGVTYRTGALGFNSGTTNALNSGVSVSYTASTDTYSLSAPDGASQTFTPADLQPANPSTPDTVQYVKQVGNTRDQLTLVAPTSGTGVPLSYTVVGTWGTTDVTGANAGTFRIAIGGVPTISSDMPKTGTATYAVNVRGTLVFGVIGPVGTPPTGRPYSLASNSTGSFTANFGAGTVQTTLNLVGTPAASGPSESFGTVSGSGNIASGSPGFTGTLSGTLSSIAATGAFSGLFLGPQAQEVGYAYTLSAGNISAVGPVVGIKQ